ncbi:MAG: non-heme iron oxygenase ferredoxin subunit [Actinomycetota bacterium]
MSRVLVGKAADLQPGMAVRVALDGRPVAVFKVGDDFFAIGDTCTHEEASLSEGYVEDDIVECPKHGAMFHIPTGAVRSLPATKDEPTFRTVLEGDELYVEG